MADDLVIYELVSRHVAHIVFNRPEKLNALFEEMYERFFEALDRARTDDDVKVVVIRGNGRAFCAGHDLSRQGSAAGFGPPLAAGSGRPQRLRERLRRDFDEYVARFRRILLYPKVTIAQVHGHCIGAGRYIAEACDLTIVADDANISWESERHGHAGGSDLWSMLLLGPKKARELGLTGGRLTGAEAAALGWASRSVPATELDAEADRIARMVAKQPRDGIALGKARRQLELEALGIAHSGVDAVIHTLFSKIGFEDDEENFYRDRKEVGVKKAMHKLTRAFEEPERKR